MVFKKSQHEIKISAIYFLTACSWFYYEAFISECNSQLKRFVFCAFICMLCTNIRHSWRLKGSEVLHLPLDLPDEMFLKLKSIREKILIHYLPFKALFKHTTCPIRYINEKLIFRGVRFERRKSGRCGCVIYLPISARYYGALNTLRSGNLEQNTELRNCAWSHPSSPAQVMEQRLLH